jgi:hypothetical protein
MVADNSQAEESAGEVDFNSDRYPTAREGIRRILEALDNPDAQVDRVEVNFLANGEATYRIWEARAEEPEGGVLPSPELAQ